MATIVPSAGNSPLWTQQGAGTAPGYSALDRRRATNAALQEGVIGALDFKVAQRGAGANMSVDIGMPAGGEALVQGDAVTGQGLYTVQCHSATVNEAVTVAHATLPRIDQVLLRVRDNTHDASGVNAADVFVLAGVATSGATLDNRTGAAALPGSCMRLADVLVPAASTTVVTANIRDRRPWARGAYALQTVITTFGVTTAGVYFTSQRVECSGAPIRLTVSGEARSGSAGDQLIIGATIDGVYVRAGGHTIVPPQTNIGDEFSVSWDVVPVAGSHAFSVFASSTTNNMVLPQPWVSIVEELVRQNASNG